jgi:hypothetical protein
MTTDKIGKVLERVAREAFEPTGYSFSCWEEVAKVLEERLGPLLRAGQAMRGDDVLGEPKFWNEVGRQMHEWDAALAILEGRDGK